MSLNHFILSSAQKPFLRVIAYHIPTRLSRIKCPFHPQKPPTDNPDVAAIVNADGNKRTDDIELQYSQRLKGKNSMLFKDISRVLDYVCDKMPGVRDFWRNRIEKPFWRAKASFTSRSRQYLTDLKTTADELGIRIGSKESAAYTYIKCTKMLILLDKENYLK